ncbi:hypothetical protein Tco_1452916, partial [Tanacetum coccineum]
GLKCETDDGDEIGERGEDVDALGRDIKTTISMMGGDVAKKDTRSGTEIHFVTIVRTKMGKT